MLLEIPTGSEGICEHQCCKEHLRTQKSRAPNLEMVPPTPFTESSVDIWQGCFRPALPQHFVEQNAS
jgi:hypothetical protein